ncbi:hypothetical protein C1646_781961 [Rhizophagus diaphanus]|nr:hypothetical protein C1646_781961 [Rhizophagus diaphanus] [Rhizophagus sp. MUCL 43196]
MPRAAGMGKKSAQPYNILYYTLRCWHGEEECLAFTSLQRAHFVLLWELHPATDGRVEANFGRETPKIRLHMMNNHAKLRMRRNLLNSTVEELTFEPHIGTLLLPYRKVLEEMRSHHIKQESQRARHLSHMLKWSVVDHSLFNGFEFVISLPRPAINMPLLESVLMENQNKRIHHAVNKNVR